VGIEEVMFLMGETNPCNVTSSCTGVLQIASFSIVFGQYLVLTKEIFTSTCQVSSSQVA
jgi:hypothetical protein